MAYHILWICTYGSTILFYDNKKQKPNETYLYSVLREIRLQGEHLAGVHIRIVRLLERFLQFVELVAGEYRPTGMRARFEVVLWGGPCGVGLPPTVLALTCAFVSSSSSSRSCLVRRW